MFVTLGFRLLANVVIFFLFARFWEVKILGDFMYIITLSGILILISDYGFNLRLVKEISSSPVRLKEYLFNSFIAKTFITVIFIIGILIYHLYISPDNVLNKEVLFLIIASYVFNSYSTFFMLPLRAIGKFNIESIQSTISNSLLFLGVAIFLILGSNPEGIAIVYLAVRLLGFVYSYILLYKYIGNFFIYKLKVRNIIIVIRNNFSYAVHLIVGTLYFQVDSLIVHKFEGGYGLGIYQAATRIIFAVLVLSDVLCNVYLPKLSSLFERKSKKEFVSSIREMNKYSFITAVVLSLLIKFFSEPLVNVIYGSNFKDTISILELLSFVLLLRFLSSSYGVLLTIQNTQRFRALAVIIALLLNILLNIFLIPTFGLVGAVYTNIISNLVLLGIYILLIQKGLRIRMFSYLQVIILVIALAILIY